MKTKPTKRSHHAKWEPLATGHWYPVGSTLRHHCGRCGLTDIVKLRIRKGGIEFKVMP